MRILVFLLVVANLVFFAWTQGYLGSRDSPDAVRLSQQLEADKLRVLSRDEPPTAAKQEKVAERAPERKAVEKCIAWSLAQADADRLDGFLAANHADLKRKRLVVPGAASWWVFMPPQPNKAEADKKAAELKRFGVPEFFIVQDAGPNRFAISLGIFSSEEAASERLEALRAKGVKSAKLGRRDGARPEQHVLDLTGGEVQVEAAREAVRELLPDAKSAACSTG